MIDNKKKKRNRCKICNAKLSLVECQIICKCGNLYCYKHRLPENHNCQFEFKPTDEENIKKAQDIRCVSEKVEKI